MFCFVCSCLKKDVVDKVESVGTPSGAPTQPVIIEDCGELKE